jgi:hypothetical protein
MVDYYKLPTPRTPPAPEPEGAEVFQEPVVTVVWNEYREAGNAKSFALKVSIRLSLKS